MIRYEETGPFQKDLKKLLKRFRTLRKDLETAKRAAIELFHVHGLDNQAVFPVPGLGTGHMQVFKLRKFACMALKGKGSRSGIRIIYAFGNGVCHFLEIYYKGDKPEMDQVRAKDFLKSG